MAPNCETLVASYAPQQPQPPPSRPRRISIEGLQRAISDLSFHLAKDAAAAAGEAAGAGTGLPPISEVEDAKCECCGMSEECTQEYIRRVQDKFSGRWICGLCSEAAKEEMVKNGGRQREALEAHMAVCGRFNRVGRTHPVLVQAEAMREILRKNARGGGRAAPGVGKKGGIMRTSSCMPAITKEISKHNRK